jgi:hypothetical protein
MFGIEDDRPLTLTIDEHNGQYSVLLDLPNIGAFITHQQLEFLSEFFSRRRAFTDDRSLGPIQIRQFGMRGQNLWVCARLRYFLDISLEDVEMEVRPCVLVDVPDLPTLVGQVAAWYLEHLSLGEVAALSGGLPVLNNLRRIAAAVGVAVTVDVHRLGLMPGIGSAFGAVLKVIAAETVGAGSTVTSMIAGLLRAVIDSVSGESVNEVGFRVAIATLVVSARAKCEEGALSAGAVEVVRQIPRVMLAPGVVALKYATKMLKYLKRSLVPGTKEERYQRVPV